MAILTYNSSYMSTAARILIAEDEPPLLRALSLKLTSAGYSVDTVSRGDDCLEKLRAGSYDLLLLDVIMPGMNGFEVLQAIQQENIAVRTFVLSNLGQDEDFKKARELGAEHYIVKAVTPLADIVNDVKDFFSPDAQGG